MTTTEGPDKDKYPNLYKVHHIDAQEKSIVGDVLEFMAIENIIDIDDVEDYVFKYFEVDKYAYEVEHEKYMEELTS